MRESDRRNRLIDLGGRLSGPPSASGYPPVGHRHLTVEAEDPAGEVVLDDRPRHGDEVAATMPLL